MTQPSTTQKPKLKDTDHLDPQGVNRLIEAIFTSAADDLALAQKKDDRRTMHAIKKFYLSARCRLLVEMAGGSYSHFLEVKGLALCDAEPLATLGQRAQASQGGPAR